MTVRFVQIMPSAFESIADKHDLSLTEQCIVLRLVLIVDHETATYRCTRSDLSERLGINRANLRRILGRLTEAGLVEESFPKGHQGWVRLPCYGDIVNVSYGAKRAVRMARSETMRPGDDDEPYGAKRAIQRRGTRQANRASPMSTSTEPRDAVEVAAVVDINDARGRASTTRGPRDWTPTPFPLGASLPCSTAHVCGCSAGGGSEATPVHPRSLNDDVNPSATNVRGLRDPRAMGMAQ